MRYLPYEASKRNGVTKAGETPESMTYTHCPGKGNLVNFTGKKVTKNQLKIPGISFNPITPFPGFFQTDLIRDIVKDFTTYQ